MSTAGEARKPSSRPPAEERRASVRYACTLETQCNRNSSIHPEPAEQQDSWEATVENLSVAGVGLRVNRRFEPGTMLTVDLCGSGQHRVQCLEMRVTRVKRAARGSWYHGCVFARQLSKEELRKLL